MNRSLHMNLVRAPVLVELEALPAVVVVGAGVVVEEVVAEVVEVAKMRRTCDSEVVAREVAFY